MRERRKDKRLELNVSITLSHLNGGVQREKMDVDIFDISQSGLGFTTNSQVELGSFYDANIQIWTKEMIETVIEIVRCEKNGDKYVCGAIFVGLMDRDAFKIKVYEMFHDAN